MTIEFTDRYGGNPPSWLRGCHGDCEAMGWVPIYRAEFDISDSDIFMIEDHPLGDGEIRAWDEAHREAKQAGDHECDGWHFVACRECHGTGRVSKRTTIARVPRWLVKGARFLPF